MEICAPESAPVEAVGLNPSNLSVFSSVGVEMNPHVDLRLHVGHLGATAFVDVSIS